MALSTDILNTPYLYLCQWRRRKILYWLCDWMPRNLDNRIEVLAPVYDKDVQADLKRIVCYGYRDTAKGRIVDGTGENRPWENRPSTLCKDFTPALAEAETAL